MAGLPIREEGLGIRRLANIGNGKLWEDDEMGGLLSASIKLLSAWSASHSVELRMWARTMVAAAVAFLLAEAARLQQGYWAVLTAIIVMQTSVGGSLKAAIDRLMGTFCGAIYGGIVGYLVPHAGGLGLDLALVASLAPLTLLAALDGRFRVAPITAIIVLFSASGQHLGPFSAAFERTLEIGLGCAVALGTALLVLPARAHNQLVGAAQSLLDLFADLLAALLSSPDDGSAGARVGDLQARVRNTLATVDKIAADARQERNGLLVGDFDPDPLQRSLLRLRHDLVMVGRAVGEPFPEPIAARLRDPLKNTSEAIGGALRGLGSVLKARRPAGQAVEVDEALQRFAEVMAELRREGLTRALTNEDIARLFALSFALAQLRRDLRNLRQRIEEAAK